MHGVFGLLANVGAKAARLGATRRPAYADPPLRLCPHMLLTALANTSVYNPALFVTLSPHLTGLLKLVLKAPDLPLPLQGMRSG